jgi:TonB-linked SusC/RagA family outer membrane protein
MYNINPITLIRSLGILIFLSITIIVNPVKAQRTVTGTVTSEDGPMAGVNVIVQGSTYGNITDLDGNYTLMIPGPTTTLVFSYVGYKTVIEAVGNRSVIDVFMQTDASQLEEVVVTGYTTQSRKNISGSISVVNPQEIATIPAGSVAEQLQGRAAGVNVTHSGYPGESPSVRIRGFGTISEYMSEPLYIVDGIPVESDIMITLNPQDVESIQILKDASAASIYGARAANGVIIITTKAGKVTDGPELAFDSYFGVQHFSAFPDMLNPEDLARLTKIGMENAGLNPVHPQYLLSDSSWALPDYLIPDGHSVALDGPVDESEYDIETNPITQANPTGTDWFEEITGAAIIQNYNLLVNGGNSNGLYAVSLGYFNQEGIVKYTGYDKITARINTRFNIKDKIRIGETLNITYDVRKNAPSYAGHPAIVQAYETPRIKPVYDIAGNYTGNKIRGLGDATNPLAELYRHKDNKVKRFLFMGSFFLEWDIIKDLTFKTSFNPMLNLTYENKEFSPSAPQNQGAGESTLAQASWNEMNWTWYNTLTYAKTFGGSHNLQVMVGTEAIDNEITTFSAMNEIFYSTDLDYQHLDAGEQILDNSGYSSSWSLFSLFGKLDYNFDGKYLFSATIRRDGSSRFGQNNRYAVFPAFSAAWRLSDEGFLQGAGVIDDLKIRVGWGQTGNQNIGDYIIYDTFKKDIQNAGYDIFGTQNTAEVGFRPEAFGNPDAKWETTTTADIGIDVSLFNNQLTGTIDFYKRVTSDMLMQVWHPGLLGHATRLWKNIGEMENSGIDFSAIYHNNLKRSFNWSIGVNLTHYKNKVTKLAEEDQMIFNGNWDMEGQRSHIITAGMPISTFYGYVIEGIYQDEQEVLDGPEYVFGEWENDSVWVPNPSEGIGRWIFADIDENDSIDINDRTYIGSPHPDFTIGIPMNFKYKGFDLMLFWYGSFGNDLYNVNKTQTDYWNTWVNPNTQKGTRLLQAWGLSGVDNEKAILPQINDFAPARESFNTSYLVEDGSYLRLNQIMLGYNFITENWNGIRNFRIYFQCNNLFTWTNYDGLDPNVVAYDFRLGLDEGYYPNVKSYMLGLNITFK